MCTQLETNRRLSEDMKRALMLRGSPVAVKLIREGESIPEGDSPPMSHCQAVERARGGEYLILPKDKENCAVGTCVLGMSATPDKVQSGEFHAGIGIHDTVEAAGSMMSKRLLVPFQTIGEIVCPLEYASFEPDVVILIDLPERIYWVVALMSAESGERAEFSTAPFQCACEDITAIPIVKQQPNISLGCFGCRKRTNMAKDEIACGIPYGLIPRYVERLLTYEKGVMTKARRD